MLRHFALAAAALTALAGCEPTSGGAGGAATGAQGGVPYGEYVLVGIGGEPVSQRNASVILAPGKISGRGPCNAYSASQSATLPAMQVGPIAATKAACADLALENRFFSALGQTRQAVYLDGVLTLKGAPKSLILEYGHQQR